MKPTQLPNGYRTNALATAMLVREAKLRWATRRLELKGKNSCELSKVSFPTTKPNQLRNKVYRVGAWVKRRS